MKPLAMRHHIELVEEPPELPYPAGPLAFADLVAEYARRFPRPVLLGTSFGGLVAIRAASILRSELAGLILVSAFARGGEVPRHFSIFRPVLPLLQVFAPVAAPFSARFIGGRNLDPAGRSELVRQARSVGVENRLRRLRIVFDVDLSNLCRTVEVPALVMHGSKDRLVPPSAGRKLASLIPRSSYHQIEGAAHLPYVTHASAFNSLVGSFLDELSGG